MAELVQTKKIAKNTLMLYFRQILVMLVSLYTVRVVLNVLGAEDYGIYNVVAGVVTMFNFLSSSMATASQRYFSYDLGKNDAEHLKVTFSVTFQIYIILCVIIFILAETLGIWFVNNKLVIPTERLFAANCIYQTATFSFILSIITAPYMACVISHEKMGVFAYVSIIECILKLCVVFALRFILIDKLILYGILLSLVALINTSIYRIYCHKKFDECRFKIYKDKDLFKELVSYSSWNLFGSSVGVVKNQIINILLNLYFGPIVNAARGISHQVSNAVNSFGQNFTVAMRPQIIKSYAAENTEECLNLVYRGCKLTFLMMLIFILPLELKMDFVLNLWLKNPPDNAILFTRIILLDCLTDSLNYQIMTLAQATGKIKLYQSVVGGILLCNLPVSYFALRLGAPAYSVLLVSLGLTVIAMIVRLLIIKRLTDFSILNFLIKTVVPCFIVLLASTGISFFFSRLLKEGVVGFVLTVFISVLAVGIFGYFIGLSKQEKVLARNLLGKVIRKK